jgi:hypothetical protein
MNHINLIIRRTVAVTAFSALLLNLSFSSYASSEKPRKEARPGKASTAVVNYVGSQDGAPMFNVQYNNNTGAKFSVRVLDGEGNRIFLGTYTDQKFNKLFKVLNTESQGRLTFMITSFQDNSTQTFEISTDSRLVEDIDVKEIK